MTDFATYIFGCVVGAVTGAFLFALIILPHKDKEIQTLRTEAIQKGFAHYVVTEPETGKTEFQWKSHEQP